MGFNDRKRYEDDEENDHEGGYYRVKVPKLRLPKRSPPDWQQEKIDATYKLVEQNEELIELVEKIFYEIRKIRQDQISWKQHENDKAMFKDQSNSQ